MANIVKSSESLWQIHIIFLFCKLYCLVKSLSCVQLFVTPWIAASQASLSFTITQNLLKLMSIESMIHPTISSSVIPFSSCPQSFPESGSFPMSWLFTSGDQCIRASASASVLPMNIQGWFPLRLGSLTFLLSQGLPRVFCSTTIWKNQFFSIQPSLQMWELDHKVLLLMNYNWNMLNLYFKLYYA